MKDCCIVLNPNARAVRRIDLEDQLARVAPGAVVRRTSGPGEAEFLAREAVREGFETVVAAGGDGTVNEVLRGIVGTPARLGVLPVGTVNVFAQELGLPLDWEEAWTRILRGGERTVDVGWANECPFIQLAGVGFDAEVVMRVSPSAKRAFGPGAYLWSGLGQLGRAHPTLEIKADGIPTLFGAWVLVGMGRYYGGPIPLFPRACQQDGLLDVLVIREVNFRTALQCLLTVPWGGHSLLDGVEYFQTREVTIEGPAAVEVDGEAMGRTPVRFAVGAERLRVVV
jgi:diacylglycerol kinase (ATP)